MSVTYGTLCKSVADALKTVDAIKRVYNYDELAESVTDAPMVQVYPDSGSVDASGDTDRTTFSAGVRITQFTVIIDGYARRRSHLAEDMREQMKLIDAIDGLLVTQVNKPFFNNKAIQAFSWKWERAMLEYGGGERAEQYAGCRFTLQLIIY